MDNPKANKERREIVLDQMVKYGHITQAEAQKAKAEEVKIRKDESKGKQKTFVLISSITFPSWLWINSAQTLCLKAA